MTHWSIFTPPMNKRLDAEIAQYRVGFGIPKGAEPVLDDLHVAITRIDFVDDLGAPAANLITSERVPGTGCASPGSSPLGLWACRKEGLMFSKSLRTPQLTQITGMPCSRNAPISICERLDRLAVRRDIDAPAVQPAALGAEIILHVDDEQRRFGGVHHDVLRFGLDRQRPWRRRWPRHIDRVAQ